MLPQPIWGGGAGVQEYQGDLLTTITDLSAYRNIRDQVADNALVFAISDAMISQPPTKNKLSSAGC